MRPLRFGNTFIHFTTKTTRLGVVIDCKLNWKPQIDQVAKKFSGKLKFIKKMKRLPVKVLEETCFKESFHVRLIVLLYGKNGPPHHLTD